MVTHITSVAFQGIEVTEVDVQVHIASGMPAFSIVGLADKAVNESKERVRAAISSLGLSLPPKRITINLSPADLQKEGSHLDLPIALGLLASLDVIPPSELLEYSVLGELSLDGSLLPVSGALPAAIGASAAGKGLICPEENGAEAALAGELDILAPPSLLTLINHFKGTQLLSRPAPQQLSEPATYPDLADIKGQHAAKRALEIAAAGGHNLLMVGPPGAGKSMLAARLPGLLPPLNAEEMLEVSMINSIAGNLVSGGIKRQRPFRDPHHSCSMAAMVGGGTKAKPGEITLAHHGVLFLDELPEFNRSALDSMRQPLETGEVTVSRAQAHVTYPARFQLIAAMNPCRCGYLGDETRACNKAPRCAVDYLSRLSGPLLDRFDLYIEVPAVSPAEIDTLGTSESSSAVAARVGAARQHQRNRYEGETIASNAQVDGELLTRVATPDAEGKALLLQAVEQMGLSMRGHNRVLRTARTIADLEKSEHIARHHIAEALSYRHLHPRQQVAA